MIRSSTSRGLSAMYSQHQLRPYVLRAALRLERGQMQSLTLRAILSSYHQVHVGNYSYGSLLEPGRADRQTTIGNYVSIGPGVRRFGAAHPLDAPSMHPYWYNPRLKMANAADDVERTAIEIGHDVWIGAGALLLPGCSRVGNGAVIGAGAVITRDVGPYEIWVGNPGRKIRDRLTPALRSSLEASEWWLHDPKAAQALLRESGGSNSRRLHHT